MRRKESLWGFWWPFTPWSKEGIRRRNGHLHEKHQSFLAMVPILWVNYNDLTATSLEIIVNKGNHPQMAQQFRLVKYYNLPRILGKSRAFFFLCVRIRIRRDSPLLTPLFHHTFLLSQLSSPLASIHPIGNRYQITTRINPQNGEVGSFTVRISQMSRPFCIQISCQPMNRKIWDYRN